MISSVDEQQLIDQCFTSTDFPNIFQCDAHTRFPGTGKIRYWYSFGVNQSVLKTSGYDVSAAWRLNDLWLLPGALRMNLLWTHWDEYTFQTTPDTDPFDYVGEVGYNDDKVKFTLVWELGDWLVSLDNTWYSDALDDVSQQPSDYHLNQLGSIWYTDLQVRWFATDDLQLYAGVDNLFEQQPPYCPSCNNEPVPGAHYSGSQYRPWDSRFFYGGLRYSFGK